jgi:hypothetical protein
VTDLVSLPAFPFPVHVSRGVEDRRAKGVATRATEAVEWLRATTGIEPAVELFVLSGEEDWAEYAVVSIYGMPHATVGGKMVTSVDAAPLWNELVDLIWPDLSQGSRVEMEDVYGRPPDLAAGVSDLAIIHEVAHLFHLLDRRPEPPPSKWVAELFANVVMYGFVAEREPTTLPRVETIARATLEVSTDRLPLSDLWDYAEAYKQEDGAALDLWYTFVLMAHAERIWKRVGRPAVVGLRDLLVEPGVSDDELVRRLKLIHPEVGRVVTHWPRP